MGIASLMSAIIWSILVAFNGVNEKWRAIGFWIRGKSHPLFLSTSLITPTGYFGWLNPTQQISGSPKTLKPKAFNYLAKVLTAKIKI